MSPGQAKGKMVDRRTDIWAFGVVLCEMLTGRRMYEGETAAETLARIIEREPDLSVLPRPTPPAAHRSRPLPDEGSSRPPSGHRRSANPARARDRAAARRAGLRLQLLRRAPAPRNGEERLPTTQGLLTSTLVAQPKSESSPGNVWSVGDRLLDRARHERMSREYQPQQRWRHHGRYQHDDD